MRLPGLDSNKSRTTTLPIVPAPPSTIKRRLFFTALPFQSSRVCLTFWGFLARLPSFDAPACRQAGQSWTCYWEANSGKLWSELLKGIAMNKQSDCVAVSAWEPGVFLTKAKGAKIWLNGKPHLDFACGPGVANIGYNHPEILENFPKKSFSPIPGAKPWKRQYSPA